MSVTSFGVRGVALAAGLVAMLGASEIAHAGGLTLPTFGVRATGRGGAFVAGADDEMALWYNPAGLAALAGGDRKLHLLFDLADVEHPVTYSRVDSIGHAAGTVENDPQRLPHPNLVAVW